MKKIMIILMLSANFLYAQETIPEFTVTMFTINVDTVIQILPDVICEQVDLLLTTEEDTVYVGRVENGYTKMERIPEGGYGFLVTNANEIWYVGTKETTITIRYWIREETNAED